MAKERTVQKERMKGIVAVVGALLLVVKNISETFFGFEIPQELIDSTTDLLLSALTVWAAWRNNYITQKGASQLNALKKAKLD